MGKRKEIYIKASDRQGREVHQFEKTLTPCGSDWKQHFNAPTQLKGPTGSGEGGK